MISLIAAVDEKFGIGKNNQLLCRLRDDMLNFKNLTTGNIVVMGRKTYDSLPNGALPNRENIVLTRNNTDPIPGCTKMNTIEEVLELASKCSEEVFIIGGGEIYSQFISYADRLYLSFIKHNFNADTFFPEVDLDKWQLIDKQSYSSSERNDFPFDYKVFARKSD